jgi:hypothetical protein
MNTELERFEHLFVNEDELRKAIVGLLWKMPGVSGVHLTHGTQELGKDIVFYAPGPLEDRRAYACVVKNSRISGSVDSKQGATSFRQSLSLRLWPARKNRWGLYNEPL